MIYLTNGLSLQMLEGWRRVVDSDGGRAITNIRITPLTHEEIQTRIAEEEQARKCKVIVHIAQPHLRMIICDLLGVPNIPLRSTVQLSRETILFVGQVVGHVPPTVTQLPASAGVDWFEIVVDPPKLPTRAAEYREELLVVSTAHLPYREVQRIEQELERGESGKLLGAGREEGFFLYTDQADTCKALGLSVLLSVLEWCRGQGAVWVLFDRDADTVPELGTFDW